MRIAALGVPSVLAAMVLAWTPFVHAQANSGGDVKSEPLTIPDEPANQNAGGMKFNTKDDPKSPVGQPPPIKFYDSEGSGPTKMDSDHFDSSPEDEGFKTYIGYPKHRFGLNLGYDSLGADWNYKGTDFNFRANTPSFNLNYTFQMTPRFSFGVDYTHYSLSINAGNIGTQYLIDASSETFDEYYAKGNYCFLSSSSFYRQFCAGVDIGNHAYPILEFISSSELQLNRVQDIVLGLNVSGQIPASILLLKAKAGFDYGTGLGNSGSMTPKTDYEIYLTGQADWVIDQARHHDILIAVDYRYLDATVSGAVGNGTTDTWDTKASIFGAHVGYGYTFP